MADLSALQAQRQKLIDQIHAKGGKDKAANLTQQLNALDTQIRGVRGPAQPGQNPGNVPANTSTSNSRGVFNATVNSNLDQAKTGAQLANANINGPFGSSNTTFDANGNPTVTTTQNGYGAAASAYANSLLSGGAPGSNQPPGVTGSGANSSFGTDPMQQYQNAIYQQYTAGLDKRKSQDQNQLEQDLANRGIPVGSKAYSNAISNFQDNYGQQYQNAQSQAITLGNQAFNATTANLGNIAAQSYGAQNLQPYQSVLPNQVGYSDVNAQTIAANAAKKNAATAAEAARRAGRSAPADNSPIIGGPAFG